MPVDGGQVGVALDVHRHEPGGTSLLRDQGRASPLRPPHARRSERGAAKPHLAAPARLHAGEHAQDLAAPRAGESGDADDLAGAHVEVDGMHVRPVETTHLEHDVSGLRRAWREDGVDRPSGHRRDDGLGGGVGGESLGDDPPVAQDRVRVADLQHLVESVRDVQDGHAAILQLAHGVKQRGRLRIGERGGGLVEDQDTTVVGERPGQGGHRPAHRTERRGVGADVDGVAELLEQRSGLVLEATPLDLAEARDESAAEEHVFGDGQSGNDHQLLVQRGDPLNGR